MIRPPSTCPILNFAVLSKFSDVFCYVGKPNQPKVFASKEINIAGKQIQECKASLFICCVDTLFIDGE